MRIIDRYLLREIVSPTLVSFGIYTAAFLLNQFVVLAEIAAKRDVEFIEIFKLILFSFPFIIVQTFPMALLLGILLGFSRLSSDSEITAIRSIGISYYRIFRPVFTLALGSFAITLFLMVWVLPAGNTALQETRLKVFTKGLSKAVEPRIFFEKVPNFLLYTDVSEPQDPFAHGIFVYQNVPGSKIKTATFAKKARFSIDEDTGNFVAYLFESETHSFDPSEPDEYERSLSQEQVVIPPQRDTGLGSKNARIIRKKGVREMTIPELLDHAEIQKQRFHKSEEMRTEMVNRAWVEIHKKFAIPAACLVFAIIGIPLGVFNARGGKMSGFIISLGIYVFYWIFLWSGEKLSHQGKITPFWAMWLGNVLLFILGSFLFWKNNRAFQFGIWSRLKTMLFPARPYERTAYEKTHRHRTLFGIRIMDAYLIRFFLTYFLMVIGSFLVLFSIMEAVGLIGYMAEHKLPASVMFTYLYHLQPRFIVWSLPLSMLVTVMIVFTLLAKNNEVIAFRSLGVSTLRLAVPLLIMGVLASALLFSVQDFVLPQSNQKSDELNDVIHGRSPRTHARTGERWIFGDGHRLYNYALYNSFNQLFHGFHVYKLDPDTFHVKEHIYARKAQWLSENKWELTDGWVREFQTAGKESFEDFETRNFPFPQSPAYFGRGDLKSPDLMNFLELGRHIRNSKASGYQVRGLLVEYHKKFSFAFIPLIFSVLSVPFSFKVGKRGPFYGAGLAILVAVIYYAVMIFFSTMATLGYFPPVLGAWAANVIFGLLGLYFLLSAPT